MSEKDAVAFSMEKDVVTFFLPVPLPLPLPVPDFNLNHFDEQDSV